MRNNLFGFILLLMIVSCKDPKVVDPIPVNCEDHSTFEVQRFLYHNSNLWQNDNGEEFRYYVAFDSTGFFIYNDTLTVLFSIDHNNECEYKYHLKSHDGENLGEATLMLPDFSKDEVFFASDFDNILQGVWKRFKQTN